MNLDAFESQSKETIHNALNQLQTAKLLLIELETQLTATGDSIRNLSELIEAFISEERRNG